MEPQGEADPQGTPPPYVDLEAHFSADEEAALRLHRQLNEEENLLQGERTLVPYVYGFYLALLGAQAALLGGLLYAYRGDWERECDIHAKVWSVVCISRGLLQLAHNVAITTLRLRRLSPNRKLLLSSRLLYLFGFSWWLLGFKYLLMNPGCEGEATVAETVSLLLFWATAVVYAIPFFIYAVLCLFLPCIIYFIVRFAVRPADRQPTPAEVLRQLQAKPYRELIDSLKRQYNVENEALIESRDSSLIPSLSLENVIGGVSSLLGGPQGGGPQSPREDSRGGPIQPRGPSISVNKCCPICMVDLADDDTVLIMPCDSRHFFHQGCVEHWLETSQACPICRANIVRLITGAAAPPQGDREGGLEMQV
ncbi:hypothetical protein Esti_000546 [Eimeria stiedai]